MAENEKILNTRISLKYDTLERWSSSSLILKAGEVAFATVPTVEGSTLEPVMFKVGDGSKTFAQLDWACAKAADVYGWAKAAGLNVDTVKAPEGQFVEGFAWENNKLVPKFRGFITEINEANKDKLDAPTTKAVKEYVDSIVSGGVKDLATEDYVDTAIKNLSKDGGAIKAVADDLAEHEQAFGEFQTANTKAIADAVAAEAEIARAAEKTNADAIAEEAKTARAAEKANADAIAAIKDDANIDSFADVVAELAKKQDNIPANTYDAYGSASTAEQNAKNYADGILGTSSDEATANTVYGAKAAAAAAQNDATIAKTKIETFLGTVTPDGSADIIDTLAEINKYVGDHGEEFAELSKKVTDIEDGTTKINADKLDGKDATDFIWQINSTGTIDVAPVSGIHSNPQISLNVEGTKTALGLKSAAYETIDNLNATAKGYADDVEAKLPNYQPKGDYKTVQEVVADPTANGKSLTFIDAISQNTNGVITATKKNVNLDDYALKSEIPTELGVMSVTANDTENKQSGIKIDNTDPANPKVEVNDTITWIFDCGGAE